MIHNRKLNKKINKIHERTLRIVYSDHKTSFSELLKKDKSVTIHQNSVYELRSGVHIPIGNSRTVFFGTESIINLGAKLWNIVPVNIKSSESLNILKSKIK